MNPDELAGALVELKHEEALDLVRTRLDGGSSALSILASCREGMNLVGEKFQEGEYYLAELILSAEIFKAAAEILKPHLQSEGSGEALATIVLATMRGDIHDLGKNIFGTLLTAQSFDVKDLGVNVEPQELVDAVQEIKPEFVGFSSLITTSFESTKQAVELLREAGLRNGVKVMVGGGVTTPGFMEYVGADFQTLDAAEGVRYCMDQCEVAAK